MTKKYWIDGNEIVVEDDAKSVLVGKRTISLPIAPTEEEINATSEIAYRQRRNELLQETDWTANSDVTMSANMKTYRKALRDLPTHKNWPKLESADWPTKPS
tara:strand:- start:1639 stop:1944 length:306 start_codon:yes stop_codon:yes gene_type:complete